MFRFDEASQEMVNAVYAFFPLKYKSGVLGTTPS